MSSAVVGIVRTATYHVLTTVRRPYLSRNFQRAVRDASAPVMVSVGAGTVTLPGWINTDIGWRPKYFLDLTMPWPTPTQSIHRVYADNVIEHFTLPEVRVVLKNLFDALESGGRVRLATPDVGRTARIYLEDPDMAATHLARHKSKGYQAEHPVDLLNLTWTVAEHYRGYCFDYAALSSELERAGFIGIERKEAGESDDGVFAQLETRASLSERATELVVEATRP